VKGASLLRQELWTAGSNRPVLSGIAAAPTVREAIMQTGIVDGRGSSSMNRRATMRPT
jgi:hypothetical protein